jgi:hypothetical protein
VCIFYTHAGVNKKWILEAAERKKQHSGAKMAANPFLLPPTLCIKLCRVRETVILTPVEWNAVLRRYIFLLYVFLLRVPNSALQSEKVNTPAHFSCLYMKLDFGTEFAKRGNRPQCFPWTRNFAPLCPLNSPNKLK